MGTQEPRRYVRHNESQRERIITATAQLVKEWGVDDLSMSDIAERAGIGNVQFLAHFDSGIASRQGRRARPAPV